jgi:hypothetical protein
MKRQFLNKFTVTATVVVVFATVAAVSLYISNRDPVEASTSAANSDLPQKTPGTPMFSFDVAKASDWRQGPTDKVSMALFGEARADKTSACFTSVQYKTGTVDADAELQKQQRDYNVTGGSMALLGSVTSTLQTVGGEKSYDLRQYAVESSDDLKVMGGLEIGYLQLGNGYIKVDGHCEAAEELNSTIPALKAIRFTES